MRKSWLPGLILVKIKVCMNTCIVFHLVDVTFADVFFTEFFFLCLNVPQTSLRIRLPSVFLAVRYNYFFIIF